ncbi:hypothetical protein NIE88_16455 [Sporolactobacillus shoreicorticis]|uniref:Uncharacterized protein n=1 Tax=Sporolactobacillus shoreicorticis TaxID=1923877 RepID=A0ABW5S4M9_9BACL|nr:hypothetical protein [Sporolactobacillus shoreicorticis]MCO7127363.1 hypothetical protein [Sporolactobacillus shoreicorticis]
MTSEKYLKFLAIMNIILFGLACLWCTVRLNFENMKMVWLVELVLLALIILVVAVSYCIPKKKEINPFKRKSTDTMKNSILFWIKDERELMMALKTYASGYMYYTCFMFSLFLLLYILIIFDVNKIVMLNSIFLFLFFEMTFLNVKFVMDWNKYSKE